MSWKISLADSCSIHSLGHAVKHLRSDPTSFHLSVSHFVMQGRYIPKVADDSLRSGASSFEVVATLALTSPR